MKKTVLRFVFGSVLLGLILNGTPARAFDDWGKSCAAQNEQDAQALSAMSALLGRMEALAAAKQPKAGAQKLKMWRAQLKKLNANPFYCVSSRNAERFTVLENLSYTFGMYFGEGDPNGCGCSDYYPNVVRIREWDLRALKKQVSVAQARIAEIQRTIHLAIGLKARVVDVLCGEIDPMVIGDGCIVKMIPLTKVSNRYDDVRGAEYYAPQAIYMVMGDEYMDEWGSVERLRGKTVQFKNLDVSPIEIPFDSENEVINTIAHVMRVDASSVWKSKFLVFDAAPSEIRTVGRSF